MPNPYNIALTTNMVSGRDKWRPYESIIYTYPIPFDYIYTHNLYAGRIGIRPYNFYGYA